MDRETLKSKLAILIENGADDDAINAYITANAPTADEHEASIGREAGIAARGAYPVAAGALAGGALGSLAGPPGIAAGVILGGMAVPLADAGTSVYNAGARLVGKPDAQIGMPSAAVEEFMTNKMGLPVAESTGERGLQAAGSATAGAATQVPMFANLAANAASPVTRHVASFFAKAPKTQIAAAPVQAATNQVVSEETDSPLLGNLAGAASTVPVGLAGSARMRPSAAAATRQETRNAAQNAYRTSEGADVVIEQAPFDNFVSTVRPRVANDRFDRGLHPNTARILDRLDEEAGNGPLSYERLETLRRVAQSGRQIARRSGNSDDARMAQSIVRDIDNFQNNLTPNELLMGDIDVARPALNQARDLWRRNAKMHTVETIMDVADDLDDPKIIQQRFRSLVKDREEFGQFTRQEQRVIRSIARTGSLDAIGKLSPASDLFGMIKAAGWAAAGAANPATLAVPAIAMGAKYAGNRSRESAVQSLQDTISRGGTAAPNRLYFRRPAATIRQVSEPTMLKSPLYTIEEQKADRARRRVLGEP